MLDRITPVILTFNEAPNIARTLAQLTWAREIVVVDSFSTDDTLALVARVPQARVVQRKFDSHASQWNFATAETGITGDWILALDADYLFTDAVIAEIRALDADGPADGYTASFRYCINGAPLTGTLYPPVTVLFRRTKGRFHQDGHTHRLMLDGTARMLKNKVMHDDRKTLSHWLAAQDRYMQLEAEIISTTPWAKLGLADRVRRFPLIAPFAVFANCYFLKRGFLDGHAGLYYALQRMLAEALLGLRVIERRMGLGNGGRER